MLDFLTNPIVAAVIKSAIVIFALLTAFAYMTLIGAWWRRCRAGWGRTVQALAASSSR